MSTNADRRPIPDDPPSDTIERFEAVIEHWLSSEHLEPTAVGLIASEPDDTSPPQVRWFPLPDIADPIDSLIGFRLPPLFDAFGIIAPGQTDADGVGSDRTSFRVGYLCDRRGVELAAWAARGLLTVETAPLGRIPDVTKRVLGLATRPPDETTSTLFATLWLADALGAVIDRDLGAPRADWELISSLHIASYGTSVDPAALIELGHTYATSCPWAILRRRVASGMFGVDDDEAADAAWMDDGMFSRWVLGHLPRLDGLVADLGELLGESTFDQILRCLDEWGLA